jgi:beta-glucanase (GH16 family)
MISKLMKKAVTFVLSTAMAVTAITFTMPQQKVKAAPTTSSQLVWSDEFNGSSLDTSKWGYEIGTGASGWGNNELQYYTNRTDNAYVSGGALHIRAKRESYGGKNYTSARLNTNGKFTFKYGYVEARLALPSSQGIWPAFWMLGANIGSVAGLHVVKLTSWKQLMQKIEHMLRVIGIAMDIRIMERIQEILILHNIIHMDYSGTVSI